MAVIERLWDDPDFEAEHHRRALAEAKRWDGDKLAEQYDGFFRSLCRGEVGKQPKQATRAFPINDALSTTGAVPASFVAPERIRYHSRPN